MRGAAGYGSPAVVAEGPLGLAVLWAGFPLAGAALGGLLSLLAGWLAELPWAPLQSWFELVASVPEPYGLLGAGLLGAVAGLAVAVAGARELLTVEVSREGVRLLRDGIWSTFPRAGVAAAFLDGRDLVLLAPDGAEPARERTDLPADRLAEAFTGHGYRWLAADPCGGAYRRWVPGGAGTPVGADALLRARQRALDAGQALDAAELRSELARLGVVVREVRKRQYWRESHPVSPGRSGENDSHSQNGG
ncbi:hypothetical protein ACFFWC_00240 [Plantactinospora siamensis]|uniref:DUF308 domain-containing protein n=1 Tax=Plantactinospora siamensis TaxID=555372 RepID=A0ABV6NUU9_9ACTN